MGGTDGEYGGREKSVDKGRGRKFDNAGIGRVWEANGRRFIHALFGRYPSSDRAEPVLGIAEGNIRGLGHLLSQGAKEERSTTAHANRLRWRFAERPTRASSSPLVGEDREPR
jgi:hypothetical protein